MTHKLRKALNAALYSLLAMLGFAGCHYVKYGIPEIEVKYGIPDTVICMYGVMPPDTTDGNDGDKADAIERLIQQDEAETTNATTHQPD